MDDKNSRAHRTKQRTAVYGALHDAKTFVSAKKLHGILQERQTSVSLATIYRLLQSMQREDIADTLRGPDGETLYRHCDHRDHHHHLICTRCHKVVEIQAPSAEKWVGSTAADHGFTPQNHVIEIFGLCGDCSKHG